MCREPATFGRDAAIQSLHRYQAITGHESEKEGRQADDSRTGTERGQREEAGPMIKFRSKAASGLALAAASITVLAACSSGGSSSSAPSTGAVKSGGKITVSLDEDVAGFNVLQADENEAVLQWMLDQVWPSVYIVQPNLKLTLNTDVATSAKLTSTNPQTVVYQINPKATWSDGVPINADDFIYNWQAQSGNPAYKDVGGKPYLPASTAGYSSIKSVTGSNNGKTVTVVFAKPFGDWKSLFGAAGPIIAAHIAKKVGFNDGFQNFGPAVQVSGGPYQIQSYTKGQALVEVRNPHYWGTAGKLSKIVYRFITDDNQVPPAVQNGEVQLTTSPPVASVAYYQALKAVSNTTTQSIPGLEFQHIDFNQANPYLAVANVRHALAYGTNRAQMVQRIVAPVDPSIKVLQNRIWMPTQPEYQNTSGSYGTFDPGKAKTLLQQSNMTMGSDGYFHPNFGPQKGKDLTLSISTTSGVPARAQIEQLFQADMKAIGVKINIQNYDASTLFGTVGPKGEFDMIEFAWVSTPFASGNQPIYCSYTNASLCGSNWDHYANPQVDSLFNQALSTVNDTKAASVYNQADALLWKDMATLPLFQQPNVYNWSTKYGNIVPNPSNNGIPWNAHMWGLKSS
jgi:glutathione transport system substrate-binding protein